MFSILIHCHFFSWMITRGAPMTKRKPPHHSYCKALGRSKWSTGCRSFASKGFFNSWAWSNARLLGENCAVGDGEKWFSFSGEIDDKTHWLGVVAYFQTCQSFLLAPTWSQDHLPQWICGNHGEGTSERNTCSKIMSWTETPSQWTTKLVYSPSNLQIF